MQNAIQSLLNIVIDQKEPSPAVIVCSSAVEGNMARYMLFESRRFVANERSVYMLLDPEAGLICIRQMVCEWKLRKDSVLIVTLDVLKLMQRDGTTLGHHSFTNYIYVGYGKDAEDARESGLFSATLTASKATFNGLTAPNSTFNGFAGITFSESFDAASFLGVRPVKTKAPAEKAIDNNVDDDDEDEDEDDVRPPKSKLPYKVAKAPKTEAPNINLPNMVSGPWPIEVRLQLVPNLLAVLARAIHATSVGRKVVIHSRTSHVVSWLAKSLTEAGVRNYQLTSATFRREGKKTLDDFKTSGPSVLIAADVIRSGVAVYAGPYALEVHSVYPCLEVYNKQFEAVFKRYNVEAPVFVHLWDHKKEAPLLGQGQTIQDLQAEVRDKDRLLEEGKADWQAVVDENHRRGNAIKTLQSAVNLFESQHAQQGEEKAALTKELLQARADAEDFRNANADIAKATLALTDRLQAAEAEVARLKAKYEPKTIAQQLRENAKGACQVAMSGVQFENLLQLMEALEGFAGTVKVSHNEGMRMQVLAAQVLKDSLPE